MRPYLGILIDSFWEAVGNKVLWALLIGWTFLLACLAPFGYVSERSFRLTSADIDDRDKLVEKLAKGAKGQGSLAIQAVSKCLEDDFLGDVKEAVKENGDRIRPSDLAKGLNAAIQSRELYSEDAFPRAVNRKRLKPLLESEIDSLSEADVEELNRELLSLAFPLELERPRGEQLWIGYGGFKIGDALPISRRQIREFLEPFILQFIIKFGLAVLAVFVAIIVTSPIIPDTFRSGSLHLLLSKPISRVWLYLSKFFGGTVFVLVNITFVLVGLYFIAGLRFDIWNPGLLYCIPLLLFVFVIFYSVSGLAGLLWGNPIVCVVSCMIFWFCCFCLGFAKQAMLPWVEINPQIAKVRQIEDKVTVLNETGDFSVWNPEFSVWQPAIDAGGRGGTKKTFGPIYEPKSRKVLVKSFLRTPFGTTFSRSRKLNMISLGESKDEDASKPDDSDSEAPKTDAAEESTEAETADASEETSAQPEETDADDSSEALAEDSGSAESQDEEEGVGGAEESSDSTDATTDSSDEKTEDSQDDGDAEQPEENSESEGELGDNDEVADGEKDERRVKSAREARQEALWVFDQGPEIPTQCFDMLEMSDGTILAICRGGIYKLNLERLEIISAGDKALFGLLNIGSWASNTAFENIAPDSYFLSDNSSISLTEDGSGLIVFNSGTVDRLGLANGRFKVLTSSKLETKDADNTEAALVQSNNEFCVVARDGLPIEILDSNLEPKLQAELSSEEDIKQLRWIPDTNSVAIVTHSGAFRKLDCETGEMTEFQMPVSGDVTNVDWLSSDEAWVGVKPNRVYKVNFDKLSAVESYVPAASMLDNIYGWGVKPLYNLLPKPAALDDAMLYMLTGSETQSLNVVTNDLESAKVELDIWPPILANLGFVAFVLGVSCIYVARKEF